MTFWKICISRKVLVQKLWTEMRSSSQIAGFFDYQCLKNQSLSQGFCMDEVTNAQPCSSLLKLTNAAICWSGADDQIRSDYIQRDRQIDKQIYRSDRQIDRQIDKDIDIDIQIIQLFVCLYMYALTLMQELGYLLQATALTTELIK